MWFRILFAITAMALVHYFPSPSDTSSEKVAAGGRNIPTYYFLLVIASTVLASFASTVQFVGISAFHTIIADPAVGGTYMTVGHLSVSQQKKIEDYELMMRGLVTFSQLVNTLSNLGGTWPRFFVLRGIDTLTKATCYIQSESSLEPILLPAHDCSSEHSKLACADLGGQCKIERDGYYVTSAICIAIGAILLITFVQPTARKLQGE